MIGQPFFSVVLPTKDRPALLRDAIRSVLCQNFEDYELIVSDNFNAARTRQVIDLFLGNPRLRYFRTEAELPMPSHWEFATTQARGRYILILTDRSVLKQHALRKIHHAILSHGEEIAVCSWRWSLFDDTTGVVFGDGVREDRGEVKVLDSKEIARAFVNRSDYSPYLLPRGLNSCYHRRLAQEIRERVGGMFLPINPDFTSAFLLLASTAQTIHLSETLFISQGLRVSNGGRGVASTSLPYLETLERKNFYDFVPIKAAIVENLTFNDFLMVQNLAGGALSGIRVNWAEYFVACYRELLEKRGAGVIDGSTLAGMFVEWERALAEFDPATRSAVKTRISKLSPLRVKMLLKRSPVGPFLLGLKLQVASARLGRTSQHRNVLRAAGFDPPPA